MKFRILRMENGIAVRVGDRLDSFILFYLLTLGEGKQRATRVCRALGSSLEFSKHKSYFGFAPELPRNLAAAL